MSNFFVKLAENNQFKRIKTSLKKGIHFSWKDACIRFLIQSIEYDHLKIVQWLLKKGANPTCGTADRNVLEAVAERNDNMKTLDLFLEYLFIHCNRYPGTLNKMFVEIILIKGFFEITENITDQALAQQNYSIITARMYAMLKAGAFLNPKSLLHQMKAFKYDVESIKTLQEEVSSLSQTQWQKFKPDYLNFINSQRKKTLKHKSFYDLCCVLHQIHGKEQRFLDKYDEYYQWIEKTVEHFLKEGVFLPTGIIEQWGNTSNRLMRNIVLTFFYTYSQKEIANFQQEKSLLLLSLLNLPLELRIHIAQYLLSPYMETSSFSRNEQALLQAHKKLQRKISQLHTTTDNIKRIIPTPTFSNH